MKRKLVIPFLLFIMACGGRDKGVEKNEDLSVTDLPEVAKKMGEEVKQAQDRWAERKAKGDTLAMPYKDLQAYLPDVNGYSKDGGPKGSQVNMPGMGSWSQTDQEYSNGDKRIKVQIVDYNASQMAFSGVTAMYKMGYSMEDDNEKSGTIDIGLKDVAAYETIYKKDKRSKLVLIVADRFMIELENEGSEDPEFLRSVAKNMKLSELAAK
jgi:hypothetical protein